MNALPDRPLTWQELTLVSVLSVLVAGAGLILAGTALTITVRAGQVWASIVLVLAAIFSVVVLLILLSL
jgi:hypothetical protein